MYFVQCFLLQEREQVVVEYKNGINYGFNSDNEEVLSLINNARLKTLRGFLTEDDNLYLWDADLWIHNQISELLKTDGIRFGAGYFRKNDSYIIKSRSEESKLKLLASPRIQVTGLKVM